MDNFAPDAPAIFAPAPRRAPRARLLLALLLPLAGCGSDTATTTKPPAKPDGKEVSSRPTWTTSTSNTPTTPTTPPGPATADPNAPAGKPAPSDRKTWALLLGAFGGPGADRQAATLAALASQQGGMSGAFVERRGEGFAALYGSYDEPGSAQARKDLAAARDLVIGGARPFESAIMAAPAVRGVAGTTPEWDLRNVRQFNAPKSAAVTLQVGIYGRTSGPRPTPDELAEIRKAAEEAVRALRQQGEQAFYYHGDERSTVTIGLFPDPADPAIALLQKRFPYNMLNGQTTTNAKAAISGNKPQPSFPVGVR